MTLTGYPWKGYNSKHSVDDDKDDIDATDASVKSNTLESVASQISQLALSTTVNAGKVSDIVNSSVDIDKKIQALIKKVLFPY